MTGFRISNLKSQIFLLCLALCPASALAQSPDPEKSAEKLITPDARRGIDQGLQWLASRQNDDGSFGGGQQRNNAAICGLSGMAFLAGGSTPGRGPYGDRVQRAVDYLLSLSSVAKPDGFICETPPTTQGPMYSHGFATLFLAECYGMSPRKDLREKLKSAVQLIVDSQHADGGWRYYPKKEEVADVSVTSCEVAALRAAYNAGIHVPKEKEAFQKAVKFLRQCENRDGGFAYMLGSGRSDFPRSAACVVALNSAGIYPSGDAAKGAEIAKSLDYLMQFLPKRGDVRREQEYFEYGHYYAVQAMWQAGGDRWAAWYPAVRDDLLKRQQPGPSWPSGAYGAEYATAMSLLVLEMPENQLPIFQR